MSFHKTALFLACALVAGMVHQGAAGVINIPNASFEDPALDDGTQGFFNDGDYGWSGDNQDGAQVRALRVDSQFSGVTGLNVCYTVPTFNFYTRGFDLGTNLSSNTAYTLSFDVLYRNNDGGTDGGALVNIGMYTGSDWAGKTSLVEYAGNIAVSSTNLKETKVLEFTTGTVAAGTKFWIGGSNDGDWSNTAYYDNFNLSASPIPEPSTFVLLVVGLIGLVAYAWRKRK